MHFEAVVTNESVTADGINVLFLTRVLAAKKN